MVADGRLAAGFMTWVHLYADRLSEEHQTH